MNLCISGWSLYNNPYYTGQNSRSASSSGDSSGSLATSGDSLFLSSEFSQRLAAAVQNSSKNRDSSTGQNAASGQMMPPPPPPPADSEAIALDETSAELMEQRAANLEAAYSEVSELDPETMTEEEIDAALASIKAILETEGANSVTEAEEEAGIQAGFDLSALEGLAALSLEEKIEALDNLQSEIVDKYENMSQAPDLPGAAGAGQGPPPGGPPPGGPPPGGPPPGGSPPVEEETQSALESISPFLEEETSASGELTASEEEELNSLIELISRDYEPVSPFSTLNVNGISGSLLKTLWSSYSQQPENSAPGASVLNQI